MATPHPGESPRLSRRHPAQMSHGDTPPRCVTAPPGARSPATQHPTSATRRPAPGAQSPATRRPVTRVSLYEIASHVNNYNEIDTPRVKAESRSVVSFISVVSDFSQLRDRPTCQNRNAAVVACVSPCEPHTSGVVACVSPCEPHTSGVVACVSPCEPHTSGVVACVSPCEPHTSGVVACVRMRLVVSERVCRQLPAGEHDRQPARRPGV